MRAPTWVRTGTGTGSGTATATGTGSGPGSGYVCELGFLLSSVSFKGLLLCCCALSPATWTSVKHNADTLSVDFKRERERERARERAEREGYLN